MQLHGDRMTASQQQEGILTGSSAASNPVGVISLNWPASSKIFDQMIPKLAQMLVIAMVLNGHLFYLYRFNNTLTILC